MHGLTGPEVEGVQDDAERVRKRGRLGVDPEGDGYVVDGLDVVAAGNNGGDLVPSLDGLGHRNAVDARVSAGDQGRGGGDGGSELHGYLGWEGFKRM